MTMHNMPAQLARLAASRRDSVVELAASLVRAPSRGGEDDYGRVITILEDWLARHGLATRRLHLPHGGVVGVTCEVRGAGPGPRWILDACVDTAPVGNEAAWSFPPWSGEVVGGWLQGRGSADSKTAAAIFCHIASLIAADAERLHGSLVLLFDADEHTGAFGGVNAFFDDAELSGDVAGVMIGYPGLDHVVVGGRGVLRLRICVFGVGSHSGGRVVTPNAIAKASKIVSALSEAELPSGGPDFPIPPRVTITMIEGGSGFSVVPDRCTIGVDIRLTPDFDAEVAEATVREIVTTVDKTDESPMSSSLEVVTSWPHFRVGQATQPAAALLDAAHAVGLRPTPKIAGPSNIGNYLAQRGIPATAGFGVRYEGLHGLDERVSVESIPAVQAAYHLAVVDLMSTDQPS